MAAIWHSPVPKDERELQIPTLPPLSGNGFSARYSAVPESPPPMLLTRASYMGTLAAARSLGRTGVPIHVADQKRTDLTMWSRYVMRRLTAPDVEEGDAFLTWLIAHGRQNPGAVFYPTSDETAWLIASHRYALSAYYRLYSPSTDCLFALLNKCALHQWCQRVGIATPLTFFPETEEEMARLAPQLRYPVIVKPRTQVFCASHFKGDVFYSPEALMNEFRQFVRYPHYSLHSLTSDPHLHCPLVQEFLPQAMESIYSLSGFLDASGEVSAVCAARKVLQYPRRVGIGLCFEEAEVDLDLWRRLRNLFRQVGYYGVFEVEFIPVRQDDASTVYLLTDVNPRFYNQMHFDIARGVPLAEFIYHAALEDGFPWRTRSHTTPRADSLPTTYCHRSQFRLMLHSQRAARSMDSVEYQRWESWFQQRHKQMVDPVQDTRDPMPALVNTMAVLGSVVRHPRSFYHRIAKNE